MKKDLKPDDHGPQDGAVPVRRRTLPDDGQRGRTKDSGPAGCARAPERGTTAIALGGNFARPSDAKPGVETELDEHAGRPAGGRCPAGSPCDHDWEDLDYFFLDTAASTDSGMQVLQRCRRCWLERTVFR